MKINNILDQAKEINRGIFPIIVGIFLIFAITEELKPGFFTFYISEWILILPLIISGILFANTVRRKEKEVPVLFRIVATIIFQTIFTIGFFWKTKEIELSNLAFISIFLSTFSIFFLFQIGVLYSSNEQQYIWGKRKTIFSILYRIILFLLCLFLIGIFIYWLKDPLSFERIIDF